jgi:hypothetical protein
VRETLKDKEDKGDKGDKGDKEDFFNDQLSQLSVPSLLNYCKDAIYCVSTELLNY